ncbi:hypothetical protein ACFQZ8_28470, partial [Micromonospora azadirachtae]
MRSGTGRDVPGRGRRVGPDVVAAKARWQAPSLSRQQARSSWDVDPPLGGGGGDVGTVLRR